MRKRKWFPHFQVFSVKCHLGSQFHFDKKIKAMEIKNKKQSVKQIFVFCCDFDAPIQLLFGNG